jgi:CBS domain-containing protein
MNTFARTWLEPLSPHLLFNQGPINPAHPRKGERLTVWPWPIRLKELRRHSAGVTRPEMPQTIRDAAVDAHPGVSDTARANTGADPVRVRHVMSTDVVTVSPDTPVQDIADLMIQQRISSVPVVDRAGRLVGIVSDGDLISRVEIGTEPRRSWWRSLLNGARVAAYEYVRTHGRKASDVMTRDPVTTTEFTPLQKAVGLLEKRRFKQLPVMRGERLVGMISRTDLIRNLASHSSASPMGPEQVSDDAVRERVAARMESLPWNMRVKAINTTVQDGVATIYGWVASGIERRALQVVAENTPGVRAVEDRVHSVPPYV